MKNRKPWQEALISIWAVVFAISMILGTLTIAINSKSQDVGYYGQFQRDNNIDEVTSKSHDELDLINMNIVFYLQTGKDALLENDFNDREVSHMRDVYGLYELSSRVMNFTVTFVLFSLALAIFIRVKNDLIKRGLIAIAIILALILILVLIISTDFSKYFTIFHEIFFDNDLWILNPDTDLMIQMMPIEFFIQMALRIFKYFAFLLVSISLAMGLDMYIAKKNNKECSLCSSKEVE